MFNKRLIGALLTLVCVFLIACNHSQDISVEVAKRELLVASCKTSFYTDEEFYDDTIKVDRKTADGVKTRLEPDEFVLDFSACDNTKSGKYEVKLYLKDKTTMNVNKNIYGSYQIEVVPKYRKSIKILGIGNSFTDDSVWRLNSLLNGLGVEEVLIGDMFIGGASIENHYTNSLTDGANYEFRVWRNGVYSNTPGTSLATSLNFADWDIVVLQQQSVNAGIKSSFEYLPNLIDYVKSYCPNSKLAWNMTWAYDGDHPNILQNIGQTSADLFLRHFDGDTDKHYQGITKVTKEVILASNRFDYVIPTGTTIQNMRSGFDSSLIHRDGFHLNLNEGRFAAALTWAKIFTELDIDNVVFDDKDVSRENQIKIIACVNNAVKCPFDETEL